MDTGFIPTPVVRGLRFLFGKRARHWPAFSNLVTSRVGLEIGGPSAIFSDRGVLPIYSAATRVDNCVFAARTMWSNEDKGGQTFKYHPAKPAGRNFIREATCLSGIEDSFYGFVLASHSLEHIANPIKAVREWIRVTKPAGSLVVILPHYKHTFDRRRKVTPVSHMRDDYERNIGEDDETHLSEIIECHDLSLHPGPITRDQLRAGILDNFRNRCAHHHVFNEENSSELLRACGLNVESVQFIKPYHIVLLARNERDATDFR